MKIRKKFDKQHIVFDALFKFVNINIDVLSNNENEFDILFIIIFVKMKKKPSQKICCKLFYWFQLKFFLMFLINKSLKTTFVFFFIEKMISFFNQIISFLTITFLNFVVCVYRLQLFRIFWRQFRIKITSNLHVVTKKSFLFITFEICRDIYVIFWNIILNVKCFEFVVIDRMIRFN